MKTEKKQAKTTSKFNLEKMKVAQLDNLHLVNGGDGSKLGGDPETVTNTIIMIPPQDGLI
ncbi:MAG: hypothetical protein ACOVKP_02870 [Flavobacterium sp.]